MAYSVAKGQNIYPGHTDAQKGKLRITVTKADNTHCHTIKCVFGSGNERVERYITPSGGLSTEAVIMSNTSVEVNLSNGSYNEVHRAYSTVIVGTYDIVCTTYPSLNANIASGMLGSPATTTAFIKYEEQYCAPNLTASITLLETQKEFALTQSANKLVAYRNAHFSVTVAPKFGSTIVSGNPTESYNANFNILYKKTFDFWVKDSRGYTTRKSVKPDIVPYFVPSVTATVTRKANDGVYNGASLTCRGNIFLGKFSADKDNTLLSLAYRCKRLHSTEEPDWELAPLTELRLGQNTFEVPNVALKFNGSTSGFDEHEDYCVEIQISDGWLNPSNSNSNQNILLSKIDASVVLYGAKPMFDYGKNDFNFNVPIKYKNTNLFDIIYPIGSVYMRTSSTLPQAMSDIGSWTSISSGITGVYAWKRTS